LIYAFYRPAGFTGLGIMKSMLFLLVVLCVFKTLRLFSGKEKMLVPLAVTMLVLAYAVRFRLDLRPYYFTYIFLSLFFYIMLRYRKAGTGLYLLPLAQLFWSNAHGGNILGPMLLWTFVATEMIRQKRVALNLIIPAVLVLGASWLNPESLKETAGISRFAPLEGSGARDLGEWQPMTKDLLWGFGLRYTIGYQALVAISFLFLVMEAAKKRFDPFLIILFAASVIYPLKHVRLIPEASILLAPMFYCFLKHLFSLIPQPGRTSTAGAALTGALILYLGVFSVIKSDYYSFGFGLKEGIFPDGALQFLDRNGIGGNAFNTVAAGSYMVWRSPHRKVYIDGRLIQGESQALYDKAIKNMEGFNELDDRYNINYAVLDYDPKVRWRYPLHLNSAEDWALVYWDRSSVLYLKRNNDNRRLIQEEGYKILRPHFNDFSYLDRYLSMDRDTVLELIEEDVSRNPGNQEAHLAKAYVCYYYGLKETALNELRISLQLAPDTAFEHISTAQLLAEFGKINEAREELEHAISLDPHNDAAMEMLKSIK
jgi:tetratricopeptide (TPR) repeat protein